MDGCHSRGYNTKSKKTKQNTHSLSLQLVSLSQVCGSEKCRSKSFNQLRNIEKF